MATNLTDLAFSLISRGKGRCLLYLLDAQHQKLELYQSKKEDGSLAIKNKEGDIVDLWVLRHNSPLLIEDSKNDFRFDPEKLNLD